MSFTRNKRPLFSSSLGRTREWQSVPIKSELLFHTVINYSYYLYTASVIEHICMRASLPLCSLTSDCFKRCVCPSWPRFVENPLILQDFSFTFAQTKKIKTTHSSQTADSCSDVPGWHIIFRKKGNFQHFGAGNDDLLAGSGHGLAGDAVHLVEGVGPQVAIVGRADEHLQVHRLLAVAQQLRGHAE